MLLSENVADDASPRPAYLAGTIIGWLIVSALALAVLGLSIALGWWIAGALS